MGVLTWHILPLLCLSIRPLSPRLLHLLHHLPPTTYLSGVAVVQHVSTLLRCFRSWARLRRPWKPELSQTRPYPSSDRGNYRSIPYRVYRISYGVYRTGMSYWYVLSRFFLYVVRTSYDSSIKSCHLNSTTQPSKSCCDYTKKSDKSHNLGPFLLRFWHFSLY